jgi:ATP/maltotriose-dependent transcriptional regulator MalT
MFLSRYTIKSQAMSIYRKLPQATASYRKLGASSQAVARSRELGLLQG